MSRSSAEKEYRALAYAISKLLCLKQLLKALNINVPSCKVFCDNTSVIQMESNPMSHDRPKHIDIDCHFTREHISTNFVKLIHISFKYQLADPLTKALPRNSFYYLITKLRIFNIYLPTWVGVLWTWCKSLLLVVICCYN